MAAELEVLFVQPPGDGPLDRVQLGTHFVQPLRECCNLVAENGVVGLQESVLLDERPDLRDDVLRLALGQASCGLRDSLLDRRAGEPRDDRRFRRRRTRLRIGTPHAIWLAPVAQGFRRAKRHRRLGLALGR